MALPNRETFERLLYAIHNIGPGVEPGCSRGAALNDAALALTSDIYTKLQAWGEIPGMAEGFEMVIRLLAEASLADDVAAYCQEEIRRGESGERCESDPGLYLVRK